MVVLRKCLNCYNNFTLENKECIEDYEIPLFCSHCGASLLVTEENFDKVTELFKEDLKFFVSNKDVDDFLFVLELPFDLDKNFYKVTH